MNFMTWPAPWVSVLEAEGLPEEEASPARHAAATFAAFVVAGIFLFCPISSPA